MPLLPRSRVGEQMKSPYPTDCPPDNQREMDNNTQHAAKDWYDFVPPAPSTTATLAFNLDDPDGLRRLVEYLDAPKWKSAVREFDQWIRGLVKYGEVTVNEESIRERFHVIFGEHGIDIWED